MQILFSIPDSFCSSTLKPYTVIWILFIHKMMILACSCIWVGCCATSLLEMKPIWDRVNNYCMCCFVSFVFILCKTVFSAAHTKRPISLQPQNSQSHPAKHCRYVKYWAMITDNHKTRGLNQPTLVPQWSKCSACLFQAKTSSKLTMYSQLSPSEHLFVSDHFFMHQGQLLTRDRKQNLNNYVKFLACRTVVSMKINSILMGSTIMYSQMYFERNNE